LKPLFLVRHSDAFPEISAEGRTSWSNSSFDLPSKHFSGNAYALTRRPR
jgi:hypothetical protein